MKLATANQLKGFTLVELLVTVAIIGILASISIPLFSQYKRQARITELLVYVNQWETASETIGADLIDAGYLGFHATHIFYADGTNQFTKNNIPGVYTYPEALIAQFRKKSVEEKMFIRLQVADNGLGYEKFSELYHCQTGAYVACIDNGSSPIYCDKIIDDPNQSWARC